MKYRGFRVNYEPWKATNYSPLEYYRTSEDIELNRQRIREKYNMNLTGIAGQIGQNQIGYK